MDLKRRTVGGVKWTSISAIFSVLVQLLQIAILTRFLDKADFGLMAMALFVIGISTVFVDMGISNAIIHKQRVNKFQLSTLFWLNPCIGAVVFLIILSLSPLISVFYNTPELEPVINWAAISFLILPWGQQFDVLRRDFKFKPLAIRNIAARSLGCIVAVVLAYLGFGVYALVFANLASILISTGLLVFLGLKDTIYRPKAVFSLRSIRGKGFFSFGLFQMGEKFISYFNTNFDTLIIGKLLGMDALGLYEVAKNLAFRVYLIVNPIITKVAFPALAKVQNNISQVKRAFFNIITVLSSVNAPLHFVMILLADPLIQLIFGLEWVNAVPVFRLVVISALCSSIGNPVGSLQLAMGRADWGFYWNLGRFCVLPIVIFIGAQYGIIGVATALAMFRIVITFYLSWRLFIGNLTKSTYLEYFNSFSRPLLLAGISSLPTLVVLIIWPNSNPYIKVIIGATLYFITYLGMNLSLNRKHVIEIINLINIKPLNKIKNLLQ